RRAADIFRRTASAIWVLPARRFGLIRTGNFSLSFLPTEFIRPARMTKSRLCVPPFMTPLSKPSAWFIQISSIESPITAPFCAHSPLLNERWPTDSHDPNAALNAKIESGHDEEATPDDGTAESPNAGTRFEIDAGYPPGNSSRRRHGGESRRPGIARHCAIRGRAVTGASERRKAFLCRRGNQWTSCIARCRGNSADIWHACEHGSGRDCGRTPRAHAC